jgi:hypothetical protein
LEVVSWWLGLGLLVLLFIGSKLANLAHWVEVIVEEHVRVCRWISVEASMGLGKRVVEVLLLPCGSFELVYEGFWFLVRCKLAFLCL